jgi:penicillin-binding protein 1C
VVAATFAEIKAAFRPSETIILDRQGVVLHRLRTNTSVRQGQWVALADVSPALRHALVLSEDKRFYAHSGVDWQAVSSAAWGNLWNTRTRGASTITMQLVGLLDAELQRRVGGRSVLQKINQTLSAQQLERSWKKDQILEAYLNLVPFRGELVGIDAVSQTLFGKAAHGLDQREAAIVAALVRAPNAGVGSVAQRACAVLRDLQPRSAPADCAALELFTQAVLQRRDYAPSQGIAPHLAQRLVRGNNNLNGNTNDNFITSSVYAPLQRFAVMTLQQQLRELARRHVEDGALVVLDNASGEVLAWVGSSGALSQAAEVDGVTALRQPGSTLKPFLYAQALAERRITAASLIEDSATEIQTSAGLYIPQNYDHQFKGWVSVRTALGASLNVPAVRTLAMVSPDAFQKQLLKFGLPLKENGDYYGYSLALGSAEVSLLNLSNAYRALANGGRWGAVVLQPTSRPIAKTPVLEAGAAFIVGDILSDANARTRTFGSDSLLATRFWSAVKTGTSKDMRDNWAIGWSRDYTVGVWVGNASGAPMWDVSGTTGAAPIWAAVMNFLHAHRPSRAPTPPPGLVRAPVRFAHAPGSTVLEAARDEWFIAGTQQTLFAIDFISTTAYPIRLSGQNDLKNARQSGARITTPANGTIIALDPDIPPKNQRITLQSSQHGSTALLQWRIDGKPLTRGNSAQWLPWPGRHVVQLLSARGILLDEVRLEVRGAGVRQGGATPPP